MLPRFTFLLFTLLFSVGLYAQTYTGCYEQRILSATNDALEYGNSSADVVTGAFGITMVQSWSNQKVGFRFQELPLPAGAIISNAYIQFTCKDPEKSTGPSNLEIRAQLSGDAAIFEQSPSNISDRTLTNAVVNWEPEEWRRKEYGGDDERTPNLANLMQEVIDLPNWEVNNALAFIVTGEGQRSINSFGSGNPPLLHVEYEAPNPTDPISNIYINEIAANGTTYVDETNDYEDWIELYNDNDFPVNIGGLYLSDKKDDFEKWQVATAAIIPAKGFITIWADKQTKKSGLHVDFSLNKNGETIILSQLLDNDFTVIDSMTYAPIPFKASYGRLNEEIGNWQLFGEPSPMLSNTSTTSWLDLPIIETEEGFYPQAQSVTISHVDQSAEIYYTTDGSDPNQGSNLYTVPVNISSTGTLKARAYKNGAAPSQVTSKSFLFELPSKLPVLMITTDPDNLYDSTNGIFAEGNGTGNPVYLCGEWQTANYYQNWERPAHLSFFENDGSVAFSVDAGIRVSGNCSRKYALRSLNLYLRNNQYGNKSIDYELFSDRDENYYSRLKLRNSGQDYRGTMLRDAVNHQIISEGTHLEYQSYRPTVVYINGEYWGIQNFREKYNENYFDQLYDLPSIPGEDGKIDFIKNQEFLRIIKAGDDIHFQNMFNFIADNDLTETVNYEYVKTQMDINNFIDYWISMLYIANNDWPANNKQIWRPRTDDGKWRWMLLDTDGSTNLSGATSDQGHMTDKLSKVLRDDIVGWPNDSESSLIFRKLMMHPEFASEFVQRSCTFMELVFPKEKTVPVIDAAESNLEEDIVKHLDRWAFDNPDLLELDIWQDNVNKLRTFYQERSPYFHRNLQSNFAISDSFDLQFIYDEDTEGSIFLHWNDWEIPFNYKGTYYKDLPVRVKAIPKEGFLFVQWAETGETSPEIEVVLTADATRTPIFVEDLSDATTDLAVETFSISPNPAKEFISLNIEQSGALSIFHQASSKLISTRDINSESQIISIESWTSGTYVLIFVGDDGRKVIGRFVKI